MRRGPIVGVLLAAGSAERFGSDKLAVALQDGAMLAVAALEPLAAAVDEVVAPECRGRRGHPVGFVQELYAELIALGGDEGAKSVLARHAPSLIATEDTGILRDVDTPADLLS